MLKVGFYHGSPKMVRLDVGLHYGCLSSEQEVSQGGEASDGASSQESQGDGIYNGASLWNF